jgi:hypothetical protein
MKTAPGACGALACLLLAGCCDQAAVQACEAERAARTAQALERETVSSQPGEAFELRVAAVEGVKIDASVADAACIDGRGAGARVRVTWEVKVPGVNAVRILAGNGDKADKTWVEAGASGTEATGPWINDGAVLRIESQSTGESLGLIRAKARACP